MHIRTGQGVYYVYILGNKSHTVFEVDITGDLKDRLSILEYEALRNNGKDSANVCTVLLYWEHHTDTGKALAREGEMKSWSLRKKKAFIAQHNPSWSSLNEDIFTDRYKLLL